MSLAVHYSPVSYLLYLILFVFELNTVNAMLCMKNVSLRGISIFVFACSLPCLLSIC